MRQLLFSVGGAPWGARPRKWVYKCLGVYPGQAREWDSHNGPLFGTAPTKRSMGPRLTADG